MVNFWNDKQVAPAAFRNPTASGNSSTLSYWNLAMMSFQFGRIKLMDLLRSRMGEIALPITFLNNRKREAKWIAIQPGSNLRDLFLLWVLTGRSWGRLAELMVLLYTSPSLCLCERMCVCVCVCVYIWFRVSVSSLSVEARSMVDRGVNWRVCLHFSSQAADVCIFFIAQGSSLCSALTPKVRHGNRQSICKSRCAQTLL